jgi:nitrite reductase (NADH) small subunit
MKNWVMICSIEDIPLLGSRVVKTDRGDIAIFRAPDDRIFAMHDKCPHKGGPLSQGIVLHDKVVCPLHGWQIGLEDGNAIAPDVGCAGKVAFKVEGQNIFIAL